MTKTETPARPAHPMDPARGDELTPMFTALLCWAIGREPLTDPAITNITVASDCVLAATNRDPLFNTVLGSWADTERNLRGWGTACAADTGTVEHIIAKVRGRAGVALG